MKFGVMFANTGAATTKSGAVELAQAAEAAGLDSVWTVEHVVVPEGYRSAYPYSTSGRMPGDREDFPIPDPLMWLAFVASNTETLRLGTGVLILPQRNPVVLAKEVATLDHLSGGRVLLGVGVGWLEEEFDAVGVAFARRGARTDDAIAALRALWGAADTATHDGEFFSFANVYSRPRPPGGTVPVVIGGHSIAAARRAGRLGDGFFPARGNPEELAPLLQELRRAADAAGRDPDTIEITTGAPARPELIARLADLGVHRVVLNAGDPDDVVRRARPLLDQFSAAT